MASDAYRDLENPAVVSYESRYVLLAALHSILVNYNARYKSLEN